MERMNIILHPPTKVEFLDGHAGFVTLLQAELEDLTQSNNFRMTRYIVSPNGKVIVIQSAILAQCPTNWRVMPHGKCHRQCRFNGSVRLQYIDLRSNHNIHIS